ncbi:unnamed protein product [Meganyctiphanes norvegica]|uniref:UPAR/Ly6 domain-containing protein n=1 Tax=Meganyctiphanes norvegica TaxID=48144 RepID=A0AAV2PS35_MEGNR
MSRILILVLSLFLLTTESSGLNCYTCSGENRGDLTCIDDWKNTPGVNMVDCHQGEDICCTVTRQVYREHKDTIVSFSRGCQENCKDMGFEKTEDWTSIFSITKCNTPLCNINDGSKPLPPPGGGGGGGDGSHIIPHIPGENSSTRTADATLSQLWTFLLPLLALYWR